MLYIISTPIGNLEDLTFRAKRVLGEVDLICAEDTRRTKILLKKHGIGWKEMISYHDHNKLKQTPRILQHETVALVSDAGTPGINDPGFHLIREWIRAGKQVIPIPGPSAVLAALVGSGLPTDQFHYFGFVPKTDFKRKKLFAETLVLNGTKIFYESPHRIEKTLQHLAQEHPERDLVIARELTKIHEEFVRGKAKDIPIKPYRGEIVLLLH